jgi:hypothetical protein
LPVGTYDVVAAATDVAGNTGHDSTTNELQITTATTLMAVSVVFADGQGNPLDPQAGVTLGQHFRIYVHAQDLRTAGSDVGVLSAFADVVYDTALIDVTAVVPVFNDFTTGQLDEAAGTVDEAGGLQNARPANRDPQPVFYLQARAVAPGTLTVSTAAGQSLLSENQLFGVDGDLRNQTRYGSGQLTLQATDKPWHNVVQACDVNGDGQVAPLDVLQAINDLNLHGTRNLPAQVPAGDLSGFVDVNDDGIAASLDVLLIIEYLNTHAVGEGEATGSTPSAGSGSLAAAPYRSPRTVSAVDQPSGRVIDRGDTADLAGSRAGRARPSSWPTAFPPAHRSDGWVESELESALEDLAEDVAAAWCGRLS